MTGLPEPQAYRWTSIGGHLALDLCNTVSWRLDPARTVDRLATPEDLINWFGVVGGGSAPRSLLSQVRDRPGPAEVALHAVRSLREATYRVIEADLVRASVPGAPGTPQVAASPKTLDALPKNALPKNDQPDEETTARDTELIATAWRAALAVATTGATLPWRWTVTPTDPARLVHRLALSVADLLQTADLSGLRRCDGDGCGWLFLDATRNHSRRWCDPLDCGNRARVRAYARRHRPSAMP